MTFVTQCFLCGMGSLYSKLCSKSSTLEGGHTVLGEADSPKPSDPRAAAANAAELRLSAAQQRGTKGGKLAKQLAEQNSSKPVPTPREEERLVWD